MSLRFLFQRSFSFYPEKETSLLYYQASKFSTLTAAITEKSTFYMLRIFSLNVKMDFYFF